ncbi:hypothetical protein ROS217_08044 [Roseovarius sp. 217]|nr:hypothetical protein ROS217_08044 [Roseovarius sp. 217]
MEIAQETCCKRMDFLSICHCAVTKIHYVRSVATKTALI